VRSREEYRGAPSSSEEWRGVPWRAEEHRGALTTNTCRWAHCRGWGSTVEPARTARAFGHLASADANPPTRTRAQVVLKRVEEGTAHVYGGSTDNFHARDSNPTQHLPPDVVWTRHGVDDPQYRGQHRRYRVRVVTHGLSGAQSVRRDLAMACMETFLIPVLQAVVGNDMFALGKSSAACRNASPSAKYECAPQPPRGSAARRLFFEGLQPRPSRGCLRPPRL
jgi:hypothetical protein